MPLRRFCKLLEARILPRSQGLFGARRGCVDRGGRRERDLFSDDGVQKHPSSLGLNGLMLRRKIVVDHLDRLFGHSTYFGSLASFR